MHSDNEYYLNILLENGGYKDTQKWIKYAKKHNFKRVKSRKLYSCPSCENRKLSTFAQYIYYSNLVHIKYCANCGLYFSDTLLNPEIISQHFENTYKDERYFNILRDDIYQHLVKLADKYTPLNGKVLDIGGGKGHLLNMFAKTRADATVKLNDLSKQSCTFGSEVFGIDSICCGISDLSKIKEKFDTMLIIDMIYYEPHLNDMFYTIDNLLCSDQGTLIIRIPNKLDFIKIFQLKLKYFSSQNERFFQDNVKFFNPEHIYIFSNYYLSAKLKKLGFNNISFRPSPLLCDSQKTRGAVMQILFMVTKVLNKLSFGKLILTPAKIVIARR